MNYLIVEDEPALGETLRAYLAKDGQAVLATSLAQANERVAQISPDVIILDLSMPDGDGLTWLAQWRKHL
ncbi:MAG: response regulator, partial [Lacticaseibacillus paracasei]|nr:response regulator [Lacticaseibacillus paracasei]